MENPVLSGMTITEEMMSVSEFVKGYVNHDHEEEGGVFSMDGKLTMRPCFQRSYIRENDKKWKVKLIESVIHHYPISLFFFGVNDNGTYELIDGQQRGITICDFIHGKFSIKYNGMTCYFHNLPEDVKEYILNYGLRINKCEGNKSEKLNWFGIINQPISQLTMQELRNATYNGEWLEKMKKKFSAANANVRGKEVVDKNSKYAALRYIEKPQIERQEILEMALDWASWYEFPNISEKNDRIEMYMSKHQHDTEMKEWDFYKKVIDWIWDTFLHLDENPHTCRGMKGTPHSMTGANWGKLYSMYGDKNYTEKEKKYFSKRVVELLADTDIVKYNGIYEYILDGEKNQKYLQLRAFSKDDISKMYIYQGGIDPVDGQKHEKEEFEAHHITEWSNGGKTEIGNLVLLTKESHRKCHCGEITIEKISEKRDTLWKINSPKDYEKYKALKEINEKYSFVK